jgi:hypothetical protein
MVGFLRKFFAELNAAGPTCPDIIREVNFEER